MGRTRIKICGIRDLDTALVAAEAGADALGFVFAPGSPRTIDPDAALEIATYLPPLVTKVALLVDPTPDQITWLGRRFPFDLLQLHGRESPETVARCRMACGAPIVKAIRYAPDTFESELACWGACGDIDALLIDGGAGGEGVSFDWSKAAGPLEAFSHPVVLAGGLHAANVADAIRAIGPFAVDVSSGVERARGAKDPALIEEFCRAVREADHKHEATIDPDACN